MLDEDAVVALVLDVEAVEVPVLSEAVASGGGGGGPICCMIWAKMFWALDRSPEERASPSAPRSLANGFESVLAPDEDAVVEPTLSVELTACISCINCENEFWALARLPDSSA
ncbi:MAG: hypothetical protein PHN75_11850 [Syntrophales bacterium]|nr:hypothetical protein [Syntrophales bacterium]